jgi:hypothetical protein
MRDAADEPRAALAEHGDEIGVRVPLMEENRQPDLGGKRKLRGKRRFLAIARREVAVVIEPALADRDGVRAFEQRPQSRDAVLIELVGVVRVDPGRREERPLMRGAKLDRSGAGRHRCSGYDEAGDAVFGSTPYYVVSVGIEAVVAKIDADIDQVRHGRGL